MPTLPDNYFNRFDPAKKFEKHLFIAGRGLQSAELNEIQAKSAARVRDIADVIFADGSLIRDGAVQLNPSTGVATCASGAVYMRGEVRGLIPASVTVPITGICAIGVRLVETVITSADDATLLDPATGTRNYNLPGAERFKVVAQWGWSGDGVTGDFYPIYGVTDGVLDPKQAPPSIDVVTQAIARYDRDSAGGNYVIEGMTVTRLADRVGDGFQVISVAAGRARVNGFAVDMVASARLFRDAVPITRLISLEPTLSATVGSQRINVQRIPMSGTPTVSITKQKTSTLTKGAPGTSDPIPDTSVLTIISVVQGGTTYVPTTDYTFTAGAVNWSPAGAEPTAGSSYDVTYQYVTAATPTSVDDTGYTVTGAVVGTLVQTTYAVKLPRVDRLCVNDRGGFVWIEGVSTDYDPVRPPVPNNLLPLAQIVQRWTTASSVINDGVRVIPMQDIQAINNRLDNLVLMVAQDKLSGDVKQRYTAQNKGLFTDPFIDDTYRDAGVSQTAAISRGELLLPITPTLISPASDVSVPTTCNYVDNYALSQTSRTGSMKINPYQVFSPLPAVGMLTPAVDRWTDFSVTWTSPVTQFFTNAATLGNPSFNPIAAQFTTITTVSTLASSVLAYLRQIPVHFRLEGFGNGEVLSSITFDGIAVTPLAP